MLHGCALRPNGLLDWKMRCKAEVGIDLHIDQGSWCLIGDSGGEL